MGLALELVLTGCGLCGVGLDAVVGPVETADSAVHVCLGAGVLTVLVHEGSVADGEAGICWVGIYVRAMYCKCPKTKRLESAYHARVTEVLAPITAPL